MAFRNQGAVPDLERTHSSSFVRAGSSSRRAIISSSRPGVSPEAVEPSRALSNKVGPNNGRTGMQRSSPISSAEPKRTVSNRHPSNMRNYDAALKGVECLSFEAEHRQ